jgi:1,2-diacylglycerol 3-alpha-glucosyltransferase
MILFEPEDDRQPFVILSTRSWEPIYGVDIIAQAFSQAAQELPGLRLILLGNGSQAAVLRGIFMKAGVLDRVYFRGQIAYAELPRYYRSADLYVSASHSDGTRFLSWRRWLAACLSWLRIFPATGNG